MEGDRKDFQLTYYINSNTARKALVKLAKTLEDQYSGPFGEELWDFTFKERPKAPNNINQIKKFQLEVESLKAKKIEAEKKLKNFTLQKKENYLRVDMRLFLFLEMISPALLL